MENDLESLVSYLSNLQPSSTIERLFHPTVINSDLFVITFNKHGSTIETPARSNVSTMWEISYYAKSPIEVLTVLQNLKTKVNDDLYVIPVLNSPQYLRVQGEVAFSQPFKTEDDLFGCIALIRTERREARNLPTVDPITDVNIS